MAHNLWGRIEDLLFFIASIWKTSDIFFKSKGYVFEGIFICRISKINFYIFFSIPSFAGTVGWVFPRVWIPHEAVKRRWLLERSTPLYLLFSTYLIAFLPTSLSSWITMTWSIVKSGVSSGWIPCFLARNLTYVSQSMIGMPFWVSNDINLKNRFK